MKKPLILISNDDGITSHGIRLLVEICKEIGEVVVVAPNSPQSGMGHAITVGNTLRLEASDIFDGTESYECSGTPADCVKIAKHYVLKGNKPDLVVSGINHGSNTSVSVLYSGTMSAAIEAAMEGIPAIGFSVCDYNPNAEIKHVRPFVKQIILEALKNGVPEGVALNVNIPPASSQEIKGIKICRQANAKWQEEFDERIDPYGRRYFWLAGNFVNFDKGENQDEAAIADNYISIVPCSFDLTSYPAMDQLRSNWKL